MNLSEIQQKQVEFIKARKWERFPASEVFMHLIEELGEVGSHLLYDTGYKVKGAGHEGEQTPVSEELAQVFNLFLQLCFHLDVDLEEAWKQEYEKNLSRFDIQKWQELAKEAEEENNS